MKKIKLNQLANEKLQNQEMSLVNGGYVTKCDESGCCGCGCYYYDRGGSGTTDNKNANFATNLKS